MRDVESVGEWILYESSSISSGSAREARKSETDLEEDQAVTYKNGKSEKSLVFGKRMDVEIWVQISSLPFTTYGAQSLSFFYLFHLPLI